MVILTTLFNKFDLKICVYICIYSDVCWDFVCDRHNRILSLQLFVLKVGFNRTHILVNANEFITNGLYSIICYCRFRQPGFPFLLGLVN